MRDRLTSLGGTVAVTSGAHGTQIRGSLPRVIGDADAPTPEPDRRCSRTQRQAYEWRKPDHYGEESSWVRLGG